jgi:hypothetical protein
MEQIRVPRAELVSVFRELLEGGSWKDAAGRFAPALAKDGA